MESKYHIIFVATETEYGWALENRLTGTRTRTHGRAMLRRIWKALEKVPS